MAVTKNPTSGFLERHEGEVAKAAADYIAANRPGHDCRREFEILKKACRELLVAEMVFDAVEAHLTKTGNR
jgi:hypothetical protein